MNLNRTQQALAAIPDGLRNPLINEFRSIVQHYIEQRWRPSELSGGHFCEIVYTILNGHGSGNFASVPEKPSNFVDACRRLEQNSHVPRSLQILIPRLLPALYEIRNSRSVGHVGGDVDPNHVDSVAVLSIASWIMAELVRVFHQLPSMDEAQKIVDAIAERRIPLIWKDQRIKRILDAKMSMPNQILVFLASEIKALSFDDLLRWTECSNKAYFKRTLRKLHEERKIEYNEEEGLIKILPPGTSHAEKLLKAYQ